MKCLLLVCLIVVCCGNIAQAQWGSLKGKVILDGDVPEIKPLYPKGADIKDKDVCAAQDLPDDSLVIDAETKGIANVVVWLVTKKTPKIHPALAKPAAAVVDFDQVECRFTPRVMVVRTNQELRLLNGDKIAHNTNFGGFKNTGFNPLLAPNDRVGDRRKFKLTESVPLVVTCGIHPWMKGHWLIVDHPYAVVTSKDGVFEIKDLPEGDHEFKFWHENSGYLIKNAKDPKYSMMLKIEAGKTLELPDLKVPVEKLLPQKAVAENETKK